MRRLVLRPRVRPSSSLLASSSSSTSSDHSHHDAYDLIVLGAGPVGVSAALAAAELDKRVLLVDAPAYSGALMKKNEDLSIGGPTGLFSKALRDTSKRLSVATLRGMGISEGNIWAEVRVVCEQLAAINARDRRRALSSAGVTVLEGLAKLRANAATTTTTTTTTASEEGDTGGVEKLFEVEVESPATKGGDDGGEVMRAHKVLVATGSKAFRPNGIPFDEYPGRVFDSDSINNLGYLPKSVAITGSGIIAIEFAKIFSRLGAEVTLIIRDRVPKNALEKIGLDQDVAAALVIDLVRSGIRIERGSQAVSFSCRGSGSDKDDAADGFESLLSADPERPPLLVTLEESASGGGGGGGDGGGGGSSGARGARAGAEQGPKVLKVDAYLAAVGRVPNTAALGLEALNASIATSREESSSSNDEKEGVETTATATRGGQQPSNLLDEYGNLVVGSHLETAVKGLYAAGDVVGRPFLASTGVAQAAAAIADMYPDETTLPTTRVAGSDCAGPGVVGSSSGSGRDTDSSDSRSSDSSSSSKLGLGATGADFDAGRLATDPFAFPVGLWTSPEAAYFGLSKKQALAMGVDAEEGLALYRECLRGCVFSPDGLLKLVFDKGTGRIVGVHIVGDDGRCRFLACFALHRSVGRLVGRSKYLRRASSYFQRHSSRISLTHSFTSSLAHSLSCPPALLFISVIAQRAS